MKTEKDLGALGSAIMLRTWKATPGLEGPLATNSSFLSLCVCVCVNVPYVCGACGSQKAVTDLLELPDMGARGQNGVLWESSKCP